MSTALLTTKDVTARLGCSRQTLHRLIKAGEFPKPFKVGAGVRWTADAVDQWIGLRQTSAQSGEDRPQGDSAGA